MTFNPRRIWLFFQFGMFFFATLLTATGRESESLDAGQIAKIAIYLFLVGNGILVLATRRRARVAARQLGKLLRPLGLFYVAAAVLLPMSYYPSYSVARWAISVFVLVALGALLVQYVATRNSSATLHRHLLFTYSLLLVFGLVNLVLGSADSLRAAPTGNLTHPNIMSCVVAMGVLHAFYLPALLRRRLLRVEYIPRWFVMSMSPLLLAILYSRGSIGALGFAAVAAAAYGAWKGKRKSIAVLIAVAITSVLLWATFDQQIEAMVRRGDESANLTELTGRTLIWQAVYDSTDIRAILGGFGFAVLVPGFEVQFDYGSVWGAHNAFLQAFTSIGFAGPVLFTLFLWQCARRSVVGRSGLDVPLITYHLSVLLLFVVTSLVESTFGVGTTVPMAILIALQFSLFFRQPATRRPVTRRVFRPHGPSLRPN